MEFIRINHPDPLATTNYEQPIYEFVRLGNFYCSLRVKTKQGKTLCEMLFMERDLHEFIMKAEMSSQFEYNLDENLRYNGDKNGS
jgi:hypothetical protein